MVADRRYGGALFKSNSGLFLLPACLFGGEKRSLTMRLFIYQGSTLAVSVGKQGREELRKRDSTQSSGWKPARLPTTSMAVTDPVMSNDHTVPPECLLKIDT